MKLQSKLFTSYLIVGLISLIVIGVYANTYLKEEQFLSISEFFMAQLVHLDFTLSNFLKDVEYDVESLATNRIVRTRDDRHFTNFLHADEQTFVYNMGEVEQQIIDVFANYKDHHFYANSVYMGRENGTFVRSHKRTRFTKYDPRIRPWYTLAVNHPDSVMRTVPYKSVTTDDINIGTVKALVDDQNTVFGVVGIDITLRGLTTVVSQIKIRKDSYIFLIDEQGIVLSHPDPEKQFKRYDQEGLHGFQDVMQNESGRRKPLLKNTTCYAR